MITSPSLLNLLDPKFLTDWIEALGRVAKGLKALAYLPPITDVGRHIQVSIWLSVYEYTP